MVDIGQQDMLLRSKAQHGCPQQRAMRQIPAPLRLGGGKPARLRLAIGLGQAAQIEQRNLDRQRGCDRLERLPVDGRKRRPQRGMAPHDLVDGAGKRSYIEPPDEPKRARDGIGRRAGVQLVQKPDALLSVGQRKAAERSAALLQRTVQQRALPGR